jgi:hypothetical protein
MFAPVTAETALIMNKRGKVHGKKKFVFIITESYNNPDKT